MSLIERYRENAELRAEESRNMQKLVDGKGAGRIAKLFTGRENPEE